MHKTYGIGGLAGLGAMCKEYLLMAVGLFALLLAMPAAPEAVTVPNTTFGTVDAGSFTRDFIVSSAPASITDVDIVIDFSKCDDPPPGPSDVGCIGQSFSFNEEIVFRLTSPGGTTVNLVTAGRYSGQTPGTRVIVTFDDEALALVGSTVNGLDERVLSTGRFKPVGSLAAFEGQNPNGTWTLTVQDTTGADPLQFYNALLCINEVCPSVLPPSIVIGDIDVDGDRDAVDARLVLQVLVGLVPPPINFALTADVNADGFIDNRDASLILAIGDGRIPPPPDRDRIRAVDVGNGNIAVIGIAGAVPPGSTVNLVNTANGATASVLAAMDGSLSGTLPGAMGDTIAVDINGSPARAAISSMRVFQPRLSFPAGNLPFLAIALDLNGDGSDDLVTANHGSNDVSVLLGNGDGTFQPQVRFPAGSSPTFVAAADVDNDTRPDLIITNNGSNDVSVLLGNGDGNFKTQARFVAGSGPASVAVADVNSDFLPDLIIANSGSGDVSVLLGNGDGTFQTEVRFAAGGSPTFVAAVDVNGDVLPDLIIANSGSGDVSVLLGNGDGTFQPQVRFTAGGNPVWVAVADVNNDTPPDLVVANNSSNDVSVLLGNGNGTFQPQVRFAAGTAPSSVAVADITGAGRLDLVVTNSNSDDVSVLVSNGNGTFLPQVRFAAGTAPISVTVADVNDDTRPDLVIANSPADSVSVLLHQ